MPEFSQNYNNVTLLRRKSLGSAGAYLLAAALHIDSSGCQGRSGPLGSSLGPLRGDPAPSATAHGFLSTRSMACDFSVTVVLIGKL